MQWLVTGCSSGLGLELARAILASGQRCIASSRNPDKTPLAVAEIEKLGGIWVKIDVAASDFEIRLTELVDKHGVIDVLVNNAGYAAGGVLETMEYVPTLYPKQLFLTVLEESKRLTVKWTPTSSALFVLSRPFLQACGRTKVEL